jgi:hypothetical protein
MPSQGYVNHDALKTVKRPATNKRGCCCNIGNSYSLMSVDDLRQVQTAIGGLLLESWQYPADPGQLSPASHHDLSILWRVGRIYDDGFFGLVI